MTRVLVKLAKYTTNSRSYIKNSSCYTTLQLTVTQCHVNLHLMQIEGTKIEGLRTIVGYPTNV